MKKHLHEVERRLEAIRPNPKTLFWDPKDYVGGGMSTLNYLSIKIPNVRAEFKKGYSFSKLTEKEQWKIWDYIWHNSNTFEVMLQSSYWVSSRSILEIQNYRKTLVGWLCRVDNWAHSDELSSLYSKLLEHDTKTWMPIFKSWNSSNNPWFKRQSMVGLLYYARARKKYPKASLILKFVDKHIDDDHYYVQKGVGWTLRECWNVYPMVTYDYLKKNAAKIPPAGWTAATEKLSTKDKLLLTQLRKK